MTLKYSTLCLLCLAFLIGNIVACFAQSTSNLTAEESLFAQAVALEKLDEINEVVHYQLYKKDNSNYMPSIQISDPFRESTEVFGPEMNSEECVEAFEEINGRSFLANLKEECSLTSELANPFFFAPTGFSKVTKSAVGYNVTVYGLANFDGLVFSHCKPLESTMGFKVRLLIIENGNHYDGELKELNFRIKKNAGSQPEINTTFDPTLFSNEPPCEHPFVKNGWVKCIDIQDHAQRIKFYQYLISIVNESNDNVALSKEIASGMIASVKLLDALPSLTPNPNADNLFAPKDSLLRRLQGLYSMDSSFAPRIEKEINRTEKLGGLAYELSLLASMHHYALVSKKANAFYEADKAKIELLEVWSYVYEFLHAHYSVNCSDYESALASKKAMHRKCRNKHLRYVLQKDFGAVWLEESDQHYAELNFGAYKKDIWKGTFNSFEEEALEKMKDCGKRTNDWKLVDYVNKSQLVKKPHKGDEWTNMAVSRSFLGEDPSFFIKKAVASRKMHEEKTTKTVADFGAEAVYLNHLGRTEECQAKLHAGYATCTNNQQKASLLEMEIEIEQDFERKQKLIAEYVGLKHGKSPSGSFEYGELMFQIILQDSTLSSTKKKELARKAASFYGKAKKSFVEPTTCQFRMALCSIVSSDYSKAAKMLEAALPPNRSAHLQMLGAATAYMGNDMVLFESFMNNLHATPEAYAKIQHTSSEYTFFETNFWLHEASKKLNSAGAIALEELSNTRDILDRAEKEMNYIRTVSDSTAWAYHYWLTLSHTVLDRKTEGIASGLSFNPKDLGQKMSATNLDPYFIKKNSLTVNLGRWSKLFNEAIIGDCASRPTMAFTDYVFSNPAFVSSFNCSP